MIKTENWTFEELRDGDILLDTNGNPLWEIEEIDHVNHHINRLQIVRLKDNVIISYDGYASGSPYIKDSVLLFASGYFRKFTTWKERYKN